MFRGVDYIFIVPWFLLLAVVIGVGVRRGRKKGRAQGFKAAALALVIGIIVLGALFVAMILLYYANGGH